MYATKLLNDIYHLMQPDGDHTLCGLRVSRIPMGAKLPGNLQLVEEVPQNKTVCKHCKRIKNQESSKLDSFPERGRLARKGTFSVRGLKP